MSATRDVSRGSDRLPELSHAAVSDVMRPGVMSCAPDADVVTVARIMASHHIHMVVVEDIEGAAAGGRGAWGMVSDVALVAAGVEHRENLTAGQLADTEVLVISSEDRLEKAARLMVEHEVSHLLVVAPGSGRPVGVVSTLDVAGCIAWGEA